MLKRPIHALKSLCDLLRLQLRVQHIKPAISASALIMLAACSGGSTFTGSPSSNKQGQIIRMPDNVLNALCNGQADDAVLMLTTEPLASASDRFFTAIALEESGHPARARQLYVRLMKSASTDRVKIRCGSTTLAEGTIMDEAARKLATVSQNLALLDANLRPNLQLHKGLPSGTTTKSSVAGSYSGPAMSVTAPAGQSPFGQWFAHLASYQTFDNALKNKSTLETQFPALKGIIDQWEVSVGGGTAVRLGIRVEEKSAAQSLCNAVKSQGAYCGVLDTSK